MVHPVRKPLSKSSFYDTRSTMQHPKNIMDESLQKVQELLTNKPNFPTKDRQKILDKLQNIIPIYRNSNNLYRKITEDTRIDSFVPDSMSRAMLSGDIEDEFGIRFPVQVTYILSDHVEDATISLLIDYVLSEMSQQKINKFI